jgi:hypothetical protein
MNIKSKVESKKKIMEQNEIREGIVKEIEKDEEHAKSKWRFVPDAFPEQRLRLTEAHQGVGNYWTMEIDLKPYAKKRIKVKGYLWDSDWVWLAEIV